MEEKFEWKREGRDKIDGTVDANKTNKKCGWGENEQHGSSVINGQEIVGL